MFECPQRKTGGSRHIWLCITFGHTTNGYSLHPNFEYLYRLLQYIERYFRTEYHVGID